MNNSNSNNAPFVVSEVDLCKRFGVECLIVGDVYDVDEHDRPIPEEVRKSGWSRRQPVLSLACSLKQYRLRPRKMSLCRSL